MDLLICNILLTVYSPGAKSKISPDLVSFRALKILLSPGLTSITFPESKVSSIDGFGYH